MIAPSFICRYICVLVIYISIARTFYHSQICLIYSILQSYYIISVNINIFITNVVIFYTVISAIISTSIYGLIPRRTVTIFF